MDAPHQKKRNSWPLPVSIPGNPEELDDIVSALLDTQRGRGSEYHAHRTRLKDELHRLAVILLEGLQQRQMSPTARELERDLLRLLSLTRSFGETFDNLPPAIRDFLNVNYHAQRGWDPTNHTMVDLNIGVAPMELVISAMNLTIKEYLKGWRGHRVVGRIPPSQSGPALALDRIVGDPRSFFADQIARILARELGQDKLTADIAGLIYETVVRMWVYATGLPEEGANLRRYVRAATRSVTASEKLAALLQIIEAERRSFYTDQTQFTDPVLRQKFQTRMTLLEEERVKLSKAAVSF